MPKDKEFHGVWFELVSVSGNSNNPFTPISDKHVTSPYYIHTLSSKQLMRILKLIG